MSSQSPAPEGMDFERARSFWASRAARSRSDAPHPVPSRLRGNDDDGEAEPQQNARHSLAGDPRAAQPRTPSTPYPEDDTHGPSSNTTTTTTASIERMTSMFKTRLFGGSDKNLETKRTDRPIAESLTSIQLPDMSSWKEKMRSYSKAPPKVSLSLDKISTQLKTTLNTAVAAAASDTEKAKAGLAAARNNRHRPTKRNVRSPATPALDDAVVEPELASPFGELIVVEVLAARDLAAGDLFQGESDPYVVVRFRDWDRQTNMVKSTKNPVYNERFVFWVPSSAGIKEETVTVVVMNRNLVMTDEHLGEVHIVLDVPPNEAYDEWYPLIKETGEQQGHVRIGIRRMLLTTSELHLAGQSLAANDRSLNDEDLAKHGSVIPDLWYGFAEASEPVAVAVVSQSEVLATKLNDLSRRFIGIEIASTEVTADGQRRDIF